VAAVFRDKPELITGFNPFLPPGYRIELSDDLTDSNPIKVTTPLGARLVAPHPPPTQDPVEFTEAFNYSIKIQSRLADKPDVYNNFMGILQRCLQESRPREEFYAQVFALFEGNLDLADEFSLPRPQPLEIVEIVDSDDRTDMLSQFLRTECTELMSRSKIIQKAGVGQVSHWTTGGKGVIAYQGVVDSGTYGDVFQVYSIQLWLII